MIYLNTDNLIEVDGLTNQTSDQYVNDATVAGTLYSEAGTSLATFALNYVNSSSGDYQGTLSQTVVSANCTQHNEYIIAITANTHEIGRERHFADYRGWE